MYLLKGFPTMFGLATPLVFYSAFTHARIQRSKGQTSYMLFYSIFYVAFFSLIPHKEVRFLMPILPFCILMAAECLNEQFKKRPTLVAFLLKLHLITEVGVYVIYTQLEGREWFVYKDIASRDPHSVWITERFTGPFNILMHRPNDPIKFYSSE
jgi:hypothetical protein